VCVCVCVAGRATMSQLTVTLVEALEHSGRLALEVLEVLEQCATSGARRPLVAQGAREKATSDVKGEVVCVVV